MIGLTGTFASSMTYRPPNPFVSYANMLFTIVEFQIAFLILAL